ncbi:MAG TPA: ABC transporter ATP-binding protein [Chloroflexota bacterium]|nr:ABC transporter ATP-binding protein [Chloroflexota bacterium]
MVQVAAVRPRTALGLQVDAVTKRFLRPATTSSEGEIVRALERVSLDVRESEFLSIVGPSGCGKSTLLRVMAGLVRPDEGRVLVGGKEVTGPGPERAMVFQEYALLPWADVESNVAFGLKMRGVPKATRLNRARDLIELVGLKGCEHALPRQLSGGMRQRVSLARALAVDPQVLLMDEPLGSLDEISRRGMQAELLRIWERDKKTAVFVTHSVDEAVFLSDRIVVMGTRPGRVTDVLDVGLPRPRERGIDESPDFVRIRAAVWAALGLI